MSEPNPRLETIAIHGGQSPDPQTGAVMPPVSLSSTYAQPSPGKHSGYVYARGHNPTRYAFERCIAKLENSTLSEAEDTTCGGFAYASGMAATCAVLDLLDAGDHVVFMDDLYGGTYRLLKRVRERTQNIAFSTVDMTDMQKVADVVTDKTRMIWVESPTNPLLKVVDLKPLADFGRERGIMTVCDNTFATPILQRPLESGIDITMHSATKYLAGHSDVIAGVLVTSSAKYAEELRFNQNTSGPILGPFDSYLALRGLKTLAIRMKQHCASATHLASWLANHPKIDRVSYPGLPSHDQYDVATRQMQLDGQPSGGGMITIWLKGGLPESLRFLEAVKVFTLAESLGGVESLIEHPAIMTHASVPPEAREALGICDSLIRLSVGIEHVHDLQTDLERALEAV